MFSNEIFESFLSTQSLFRYFFSFLILINFILIFSLLFQIRKANKIKFLFDLKKISELDPKKFTILIIIAHPDDEIMFFTPSILALNKLKIPIKILCLSTGNFYGIGETRKKEFESVSNYLNLKHNKILNVPELQDNLFSKWDEKFISKIIKNFLNENKDVNIIFTFDENGVTKHPNHISCFKGIEKFISENRKFVIENKYKFFLLESFNPLCQYSLFFPFVFFFFGEIGFFKNNFFEEFKIMKIYQSQFNWKRKLHVISSGYTYFNSFIKVEVENKENNNNNDNNNNNKKKID